MTVARPRFFATVGFGGSTPRKSLSVDCFGPGGVFGCPVSRGWAGFPRAEGLSWLSGLVCSRVRGRRLGRDEFGQGHQIGCCQDDFEPGGVGVEAVAGQIAQPGGFGLPDAVFDAGVLAMPQFQAGQLPGDRPGSGAGDEGGDRHSLGIGEAQLRSGVRAFLAQDQPGSGRPGVQADRTTTVGAVGSLGSGRQPAGSQAND